MFQGFTDETFEFFMAIAFNNNMEFFHANHDWYLRAARTPCLELAAALSDAVEAFDPDLERRPNRVLSRINRDIRFSHDKSPYRDHLWLGFRHPDPAKDADSPAQGVPGLYFEINAQGAAYGMGVYMENRPLMNGLRRRLVNEPQAFLDAWESARDDFKLYLRTFKRMKRPEGLHPELEPWYPVRGFWLEKEISDFALLKSPALVDELAAGFEKLAPLYRFIMETPPEAEEDRTKEPQTKSPGLE